MENSQQPEGAVMKRSLIKENEYAAEAAKHVDWVNWIFSITVFLFAITALQFNSPWKICLVGLLIIVPMYVYAFRSFPPSLVALRQLVKEDPGNEELSKLKVHLERKYHGWRAALSVSPLWISIAFYLFVMASGAEKFALLHPAISWLQA
ncbi:hypothetical protein WCE55_05025 [Luteimonas sp. MJ293]